jgi:hypothetical protein
MKKHTVESRIKEASQKVRKAIKALSEARRDIALAEREAHLESLDFDGVLIGVNESREKIFKEEVMADALEARAVFSDMINNLYAAEQALDDCARRAAELKDQDSQVGIQE